MAVYNANTLPQRIILKKTIADACGNHPQWPSLEQEIKDKFVRRIERGCLEATIDECQYDGIDRLFTDKRFVERYSKNCYRVIVNLDVLSSVGSTSLLDDLLNNKIDPYDVGKLSSDVLCPSANAPLRDVINHRKNTIYVRKVSYKHWCAKCGGNETIPQDYQSKAADEGSSTSIKCINCEYVWRKM
jgi:DNA-directed RNA polymerase subunit M/transcription elongation factor TFIIS